MANKRIPPRNIQVLLQGKNENVAKQQARPIKEVSGKNPPKKEAPKDDLGKNERIKDKPDLPTMKDPRKTVGPGDTNFP